jgi:hypothetical protein
MRQTAAGAVQSAEKAAGGLEKAAGSALGSAEDAAKTIGDRLGGAATSFFRGMGWEHLNGKSAAPK